MGASLWALEGEGEGRRRGGGGGGSSADRLTGAQVQGPLDLGPQPKEAKTHAEKALERQWLTLVESAIASSPKI